MSFAQYAHKIRAALRAAGFKRGDVSVRLCGSQIRAVINTPRLRSAARAIADAWYSDDHAWLYLWVHDANGNGIFSDLSDGFVPTLVSMKIASLPDESTPTKDTK